MPPASAFESELCDPTEEHRLLRETVRQLTRDVIEAQADEHDRSGVFNRKLFDECGKLGLLGITVPAEDGGAGMDAVAAVIAHHEMSKSDPGYTLGYLAHAMLFVNNFYFASNADQKRRYLGRVISGEWIGAMGMTEPGGGTDVLGMKTVATRTKGGYLITGRKALITNAPDAHIFLLYAKIDGRVTSFVIERSKGLTTGSPTHKMGMRASTMGEIVLDDCFVPEENLLGAEGQGVVHMMRNLELERLTLAAMSLGIADRCLQIMIEYAQQRTAFGKPLADFGQVQRYIGESYAHTEAARALVYGVARTIRHDRRNRLGSDAAKLFAAPVGKAVADNAMQVLGGWGYCDEFKVERFLRDAKLLEIGGGTLESHQKNITRDLAGR